MQVENDDKILSDGLERYMDLWRKGLKKEANQYIKKLIHTMEITLDKKLLDTVLEKFCYELCEEGQYANLKERGNGSLPHELNGLVWRYLKANCNMQRMPHMRWIYQIYRDSYNPFDPQGEINTYLMLKNAYEYEQCDQKTVDLYFQAQIDHLQWGAHHFPDCCIITEQAYIDTAKEAEQIIETHSIQKTLLERFYKWNKLYQCYYAFESSGRKKDFYQLCKEAGTDFSPVRAYYYEKK